MMQAVILAGGKGTRLATRLNGKPKPLVEVSGKPLLKRQIESLVSAGVSDIVLLVNYKKKMIERFLEENDHFGVKMTLLDDGEPKGTGGALLSALEVLDEHFLVVYGDTLFNIDLERFAAFHRGKGGAASLMVHPNDHPEDSDLIEVDADQRILGFHSYPHPPEAFVPNLVNAAMYVMRREGLRTLIPDLEEYCDLAKHVFPLMVQRGAEIYAYNSPEYIKDTGTPDRLDRAEQDIASGKFHGQSLGVKQKAVFIDRDGTLNRPAGHLSHHSQLELYSNAAKSMRALQDAQYRTVLISNQPVVARGEATLEEMSRINGKLDAELAAAGAFLDAKYLCYHHPDAGFPGEVPELKKACECRKPKPGLILQAQADLNIDLQNSWFIGDSSLDFGAAANAGVRSIGVRTGQGSADGIHPFTPGILVDDFSEAVLLITRIYPRCESSVASNWKNISESSNVVFRSASELERQCLRMIFKEKPCFWTVGENDEGEFFSKKEGGGQAPFLVDLNPCLQY